MADRTFAKFTFFKLDPAWQRRDPQARAEDKHQFLSACEDFAQDRSLRAYSTLGTRGDTDLLLLAQTQQNLRLWGVVGMPGPEEARQQAARALDLFTRAYGAKVAP